jgi:hypothetical protein
MWERPRTSGDAGGLPINCPLSNAGRKASPPTCATSKRARQCGRSASSTCPHKANTTRCSVGVGASGMSSDGLAPIVIGSRISSNGCNSSSSKPSHIGTAVGNRRSAASRARPHNAGWSQTPSTGRTRSKLSTSGCCHRPAESMPKTIDPAPFQKVEHRRKTSSRASRSPCGNTKAHSGPLAT